MEVHLTQRGKFEAQRLAEELYELQTFFKEMLKSAAKSQKRTVCVFPFPGKPECASASSIEFSATFLTDGNFAHNHNKEVKMSVVIVGGNERMEQQYKQICKQFGFKPKVFTKLPSDFKRKIGTPDLVVLFTNTVSHKMVQAAVQEASRSGAGIIRCHSSSSCALKQVLGDHCSGNCEKCSKEPSDSYLF